MIGEIWKSDLIQQRQHCWSRLVYQITKEIQIYFHILVSAICTFTKLFVQKEMN